MLAEVTGIIAETWRTMHREKEFKDLAQDLGGNNTKHGFGRHDRVFLLAQILSEIETIEEDIDYQEYVNNIQERLGSDGMLVPASRKRQERNKILVLFGTRNRDCSF